MLFSHPPQSAAFADISEVRVRALAAFFHEWETGWTYHHDPAKHPHAVQEFQLWLMQKGSVEFYNDTERWWVKENDACFIPVKFNRDIQTPHGASWLSVRLEITAFNKFSFLPNIPLPVQWHPPKAEFKKMRAWMKQIYTVRRAKQDHRRLIANGLATALLGICWPHLCSANPNPVIHTELPDWLERTLQRISADPGCTVAELAIEAKFSPAQFRRAFRQIVGMSPREYVKSKRLDTARHFLVHTNLSLGVIAERIGLYDVHYFSHLFRENYGMSPTHYRASYRAGEKEEFPS